MGINTSHPQSETTLWTDGGAYTGKKSIVYATTIPPANPDNYSNTDYPALNPRYSTTTHGKQIGVNYIIKY